VNFNSEIADEWARPVSRRAPRWARAAACCCRVAAMHRCRDRAPRFRRAAPDRASHAAPRRPSPRATRPPDSAASPLASCPNLHGAKPRRPDRAGEPPSPLSPVRRCRVVAGSPRARSCRAHARVARPMSWAAHALCTWAEPTLQVWAVPHCVSGPSANSAQCTQLNFINF
jgi:hypothetical protein